MNCIIIGGRDFQNYNYLKDNIKNLNLNINTIVCGDAKGADTLGIKYAHENDIPIKIFPIDWKYGKTSYINRNIEMGDYADYLIAFWDGKSIGTKHMIDYMEAIGKPKTVFYY